MPDVPLLVFGPRSLTYDFGSSHPLTPRRFGPGIDLLRLLGAEPGLAPEPATDEELLVCHSPRYVEVMAAARAAGLVDNKVVSFSETHTSLRLVIPVAERPRG